MEHELYEHRLDSGAKALIIHVPGSKVVSIEAYFLAGYAQVDKSEFDLPHLAEHLMLSGTKNYPSATVFNVEVEKNGAAKNAHTGAYHNSYDYVCAAFEADRILDLLAEQLTAPLFLETAFKTEMSNVREELSRNTSNYARASAVALSSKTMSNGAMVDVERIKLLNDLTREGVVRYYNLTHSASNLRLMLAGDFPDGGKELLNRFDQRVKSLPRGQRLLVPKEPEWKLTAPLIQVEPIKQIYYTLSSYLSRPLTFNEEVAADVLRKMFRGRYDSWLFGEARERGLAYDIGVSFSSGPIQSSFSLYSNVSPDNAIELFKIFAKYWEKAKTADFTEEDVDNAKGYLRGVYTLNHQTAGSLMRWYERDFGILDKVTDLNRYMEAIKTVKKSDIVDIANLIISEHQWGLSLVGNVDDRMGSELYESINLIWA